MRLLLAFLFILLTGCTIPLNRLESRISDEYLSRPEDRSIGNIKKYYFTKEAQQLIKDIPCVIGPTIAGSYVTGCNFWGSLAGFFSGVGCTRQCVLSPATLRAHGANAVIHEYIHQLDDLGRDSGEALIDLEEFKFAYSMLYFSSRHRGLVLYTEARANSWFTDIFGLGDYSEHIAYLGARIACTGEGPKYIWHVYRRILRKYE